jgi:DNA-binding transcriptional MerR regulator
VQRRYVTTTQAAEELGIPASTLRHWILKYDLRPADRTLGGHYRWDVDDLRRQIEALKRRVDFSED